MAGLVGMQKHDMRESGPAGDRTEEQLPGAVRARFESLYAAHYDLIVEYALRRTSTREDAYDVVAETFLTAWRRLDQAPEGAAVRLWLYGIARRVAANHVRGVRRRQRLQARLFSGTVNSHSTGLTDRSPEGSGVDVRDAIAAAFAQLDPDDQEILLLVGVEGLSPSEAAIVLGCRG